MMIPRTDDSLLGRWWWTVDRQLLVAVAVLAGFGTLLTMSASPAVAERIGTNTYHFVYRQFAFLGLAAVLMFAVSMLPQTVLRQLCWPVLIVSVTLLAATLVIAPEIKGARRWIPVAGLSFQASEFVKPAFAVVSAWLLAGEDPKALVHGRLLCAAMFAGIIALVAAQPDIGMTLVLLAVWFTQFYLSGLHIFWVFVLLGLGGGGALLAYLVFPHVNIRINSFLNPAHGDHYQVDRAMDAFANGGIFGSGPGEGIVKQRLPDAHSDFIFAVAGEEFGLALCLFIVMLFAFVMYRGYAWAIREQSMFAMLAVVGILVQIGIQALIHMGVTLALLPSTGMTLPFISYGGSSTMATALGLGAVLALTRRGYSWGMER